MGVPIIERQAIAFKLADMRTRIDAARLLYMRAAWMAMTGKPFSAGEGSMSKLFASETAVWVTEEAIQILGRRRLRARQSRRALAPRLEDLHDLRRHERDPASRDRSRHLRGAHSVVSAGVGVCRPSATAVSAVREAAGRETGPSKARSSSTR